MIISHLHLVQLIKFIDMTKVSSVLGTFGDIKLSEHFKLKELLSTSRFDLQENSPFVSTLYNLVYLCKYILEPLRHILDYPLVINSGYRSISLNLFVGGVSNSQHTHGCAADILLKVSNDDDILRQVDVIRQANKSGFLPFDQLIVYKKRTFIHISCNPSGTPRGQIIFK